MNGLHPLAHPFAAADRRVARILSAVVVVATGLAAFDVPTAAAQQAKPVCRWFPKKQFYATEQTLVFDFRDVAAARAGETVLRVRKREKIRATFGRKSVERRVRAAGSGTVRIGVVPDVQIPKDDSKPWRIVVDVTKLRTDPGRLDATRRKRLKKAADKLMKRLDGWTSRALKLKEKETLQRYGTLTFSAAKAVEGLSELKPRDPSLSLIAVTRPVQTGDLYRVAKALAQRLRQHFRLKNRHDQLKKQIDRQVAKLDELAKPIRDLRDDVYPTLKRARKRQQEMARIRKGINELKEETLRGLKARLAKLREQKAKAEVEAVIYVDAKKRRTSKEPKTGYVTVKTAIRAVKKTRRRVYNRLETAYLERYRAGKMPELKSAKEIKPLVKSSVTYRRLQETLKWLRERKEEQDKKRPANNPEIARLAQEIQKIRKRVSDLESRFFEVREVYIIRHPNVTSKYREAKKLLGKGHTAPAEDVFDPDKGSYRLSRKAFAWMAEREKALNGAAAAVADKTLAGLGTLVRLDGQLLVLWQFVAERRTHAAYLACKALTKQNPDVYESLVKPVNDYIKLIQPLTAFFGDLGQGDIDKWLGGKAKTKMDYAEAPLKMIRRFLEFGGEGAKKHLETLNKVVKPLKSWTDKSKVVLEAIGRYKKNDPQFLVSSLKLSKEIIGFLPLNGHPVKIAIGIYADTAAAIIGAADRIGTKLVGKAREAMKARGHMQTPERVLFSRREIKRQIIYKHYPMTDKDIDKIATDFHARRIVFLLGVKNLSQIGRHR